LIDIIDLPGDFSFANANASLTNFAPSPINICTNCGAANFKKQLFVLAAHARANIVLPVPGKKKTYQ
jgi:hypothetical protein